MHGGNSWTALEEEEEGKKALAEQKGRGELGLEEGSSFGLA